MLSAQKIADAFLSCERRKVDKSGCISFLGQKYEVKHGLSMIHRNVDIVYDPADILQVTVECEGFGTCKAVPLIIGAHSSAKPELPEHLDKLEPKSSRLLTAAGERNRVRQEVHRTAISFTGINGGDANCMRNSMK